MIIDEEKATPYAGLTPELILQAVESLDIFCDGRLLALNSYENRVYQVGVDESKPLIAKFYRPERWSDAAILEEHAFSQSLMMAEIPVVAPQFIAGKTLHDYAGYRFALFPRQGGRWPELDNLDNLAWLGRFMGRIHRQAGAGRFEHRPSLTVESFGEVSRNYLIGRNDLIPSYLMPNYQAVTETLLAHIHEHFEQLGPLRQIRLHGDCHPGNILWTESGPHFVDFDDCRMGPAIQDLWMLLSGERHEQEQQLAALIDGYNEFADFDPVELNLVEPLRALRMIHYAAWLARRWVDPAFKQNFPWFEGARYWEEHIQALREQIALMAEPPLRLL